MSNDDDTADPNDDLPSGAGFTTPAGTDPAGKPIVSLGSISLADLLDLNRKPFPYLPTCYFVFAGKDDRTTSKAPVIYGVFTISGVPLTTPVDPDFTQPLGGLSLRRIAQLLEEVRFTVKQEDQTNPARDYTLKLPCDPFSETEAGPDGGTTDSPHGDSSLLDIGFLLRYLHITVTSLSGSSNGSFGPFTITGVPTCDGHANVELGYKHGPMTLDYFVSLLSLMDWTAPPGAKAYGSGVLLAGPPIHVCYTNKSHTG